ncbi:MAG: hypothetical protein QOJ65_1263 [Fimbriimonadaceae bacterium]|jgi:hypothetical protein|nr:hypothetical protein [Fimbriimonadaceae bacterium]
MLSALAAVVLTPVVYSLSPGTVSTYYVRVGFDGYLPILGGQEGKVQVDMKLAVEGLAPDGGNLKAASDITDFHLLYNGAAFPLTLESVKGYFPKTTISFTPQGQVVKSDAPDIQLPVRLPGLDAKRFPDVTYLPIEFPAEGIEEGKSWSYKKSFGGVDVAYTIKPTKVTDEQIEMAVELAQHYDGCEDENHSPVADEKEAEAKISTDVKGIGTAIFDRKKGLVNSETLKVSADSTFSEIKSKNSTARKLTTTLDVSLDKPLPPSSVASLNGGADAGTRLLDFLGDQGKQSAAVQRALVAAKLMHPALRDGRTVGPLIASAMNHVHVPSKVAVGRKLNELAVLARETAVGIPELLHFDSVQNLGSLLRSVPGVIRTEGSPYYERAKGFAQGLIDNFSAHDPSPRQGSLVGGRQDNDQARLSPRRVKARRQVRDVLQHRAPAHRRQG